MKVIYYYYYCCYYYYNYNYYYYYHCSRVLISREEMQELIPVVGVDVKTLSPIAVYNVSLGNR